MTSLLSTTAVVIVIALLLGLLVGWWLFSRSRSTRVRAERPVKLKSTEGHGLSDEQAAAVADVAGQFLGVDVHRELPGASGPPDDLQLLKGVGSKMAAKLNENGIIRFDQLASLTPEQVETLDTRMDPFRGRIARDRLIEQACYLARDDRPGFEAKFGSLGGAPPAFRS
jgi:predicted flap endonuclease-1-like 5' DNA nuclease